MCGAAVSCQDEKGIEGNSAVHWMEVHMLSLQLPMWSAAEVHSW
jgi:hypothetical protein